MLISTMSLHPDGVVYCSGVVHSSPQCWVLFDLRRQTATGPANDLFKRWVLSNNMRFHGAVFYHESLNMHTNH